jgi:hypothetical protein
LPIDTKLNDLAFALFEFDFKLLKKVHKSAKKSSSQPHSTDPAAAQNNAQEFTDVLKQRNKIHDGTSGFAREYLANKAFIPVWNRAFKLHKQTLTSNGTDTKGDNLQNQFQECLKGYVASAMALEKAIFDTVSLELLSEDVEESIAARWRHLDNFLEWYLRNQVMIREDASPPTRDILPW